MGLQKILFLSIAYILFTTVSSLKDFLNVQVTREINLKQKIIKISNEILIKSEKMDPVYSYRYVISKNFTSTLIHTSVEMKKETSKIEIPNVKIQKTEEDQDYLYYEISFRQDPMNFEEKRIIIVKEHYFERLQFFPKKILIKEDQYMVYTDTLNYLSLYPTNTQKITVVLPNESIQLIKYTTTGANKSKEKIFYEMNKRIEPLNFRPFFIHYQNNEPFVVMNYAHRTFQVSHWGNIAISEKYQIENIGALLDGEFGRIDYDSYGRNGGKNAFKVLKANLPIRSWGLWYRDEIGNVSTSNAVREWDDVILNLYPRFPILGGWKSNFDIGYNLPSKFHVKTDGQGQYMVNLTFGMPYEDMLAKDYSIKVVLPEGAEDIQVNLPIAEQYDLLDEKDFGCLDLTGRKSVIIKMKNVYDIHKINFQIYYKYSKMSLYFKPFLLMNYFFAIFICLIIYFRSNISFGRSEIEGQTKEKME